MRRISLPHHQSAEVLAVYVQEGAVNLIVIVIYRPGSRSADSAFFREFAAIVERVASMSAPVVIVEDVNIHLDDPISPSTNNFNYIILGCNLRQLVTGPIQEAGHTLDVVITNSHHVIKVNVDPPIYSDHSLISVVIPLQNSTYVDSSVSRTIMKRNWKQLDTAAFKRDLLASDIVTQPIVDSDASSMHLIVVYERWLTNTLHCNRKHDD